MYSQFILLLFISIHFVPFRFASNSLFISSLRLVKATKQQQNIICLAFWLLRQSISVAPLAKYAINSIVYVCPNNINELCTLNYHWCISVYVTIVCWSHSHHTHTRTYTHSQCTAMIYLPNNQIFGHKLPKNQWWNSI